MFEVRKNDRNFQVGDKIVLQEYWNSKYLDRKVNVEVTYMLDRFEGLKDGYVVLGIKKQKSDETKIRERLESSLD